ncbi:MAG: hypothetical protein A2X64_05390 [Ignavibacteria bacterium GWF2_33_9]|nr:MAG: hypothetical protein A2X64_05390 [Ignavibacteria bacterium GWF2_33_9]
MDNIQIKFKIENLSEENVHTLSLAGYLDAHTAPDLETAIQEAITSGNHNILIDFEKLDYISSAGFGVFMEFIEDIRSKGGDMKMTGMNSKIKGLFDLLGFNLLFDINDDKNTLLNKFKND